MSQYEFQTRSEFIPGVVVPKGANEAANWLLFLNDKPVIIGGDVKNPIPYFDKPSRMGFKVLKHFYLGQFRGEACYGASLDPLSDLPVEYVTSELKMLLVQLPQPWFQLWGMAQQILTWDRNHQYCGACGHHTQFHSTERAKVCHDCGLVSYPRLSPCIITLVTHENKLLLGRSANFIPSLYSTLAGFIEPGETAEEAVHREVKEEVGVELGSLEYVKSQPWPFPHSLMLGFIAEYHRGEIHLADDELEDAQWWPIEKLPLIPPTGTISRSLIDFHVARYRKRAE
ncbi:MAG: NAD(+) diphosphatase [Gammaproteobacteria bacterium]|nr:NAD(+) diphosphatase [Gammaproteobacteria bacterium]